MVRGEGWGGDGGEGEWRRGGEVEGKGESGAETDREGGGWEREEINIKIKITKHNKKQRDSLKMLKDRIKYRSGIRRHGIKIGF